MIKNIFDVILEENKENLSNKEFVLKHLYIGIQKVSTEECIKRDFGFDGLESYLYVRLDINEGMASAKLNKVILEELSISEAEAWAQAQLNQHAETTIQPIFSAINKLLDNPVDDSDAISEAEETKEVPAVPSVSMDDVTKIIVQKIKQDRSNTQTIRQILRKYGTEKVSELKPAKYEAFLTDIAVL